MRPEGGWTTESVTEQLADLFADDALAGDSGLVDAAAVLASFDPETLAPFGPPPDDLEAARAELRRHSLPSYEADGTTTWILERDVRRAALARLLAAGAVRAALAVNPSRPDSLVQQTLERALFEPGDNVRAAARPDHVRAWQIVADWVRGLVPGVPDERHLQLAADRAVQLAPFRDLVGDYFAGRQRELAVLSDYVGVRAASGAAAAAWRAVRQVLSITAEPPLFVYGPGGIGKSTLIAKFVLDHVDRSDVPQFPYAYLDFDRPGLVAEEPVTLLMESLRQLSAQYPDHRSQLDALRQEWGQRIAAMTRTQAPTFMRSAPSAEVEPRDPDAPAPPPPPSAAPVPAAGESGTEVRATRYESVWSQLRLSDRDYFLETFAQEVQGLQASSSQPMLLVLDTFEEVQLRSASHVSEVFTFLDKLQAQLPFLRTVLCGRVLPEHRALRPLPLDTFDLESATAFITARVRIGREDAETVARQVSGSPLTLKLAVDLLRRAHDTPGGLSDLGAVLGALKKGSVEAQLYTRVLEHIIDPDVRKLAHPGLLLRRITPGIIQYVLAKPCGLDVPDRAAAVRLLGKLQREVVLVTARSPEVLVHRPELRTVMLKPLEAADPERARQVNRAAVVFYASQPPDPETRAEELYHRLWLGHDRATLDGRWMDGVEPYLAGGVSDLSPRAQGWLAGKMSVALPADVWRQVDLEDWERYATREVQEFLRLGHLNDASTLLAERPTYTDPALKALQVETLVRMGDVVAARRLATDTLARAPEGAAAATLRAQLRLLAVDDGPISAARGAPDPGPSGAEPPHRPAATPGDEEHSPWVAEQFVPVMGECLADAYPDFTNLAAMLRHFGLETLLPGQASQLRQPSATLAPLVASRAAAVGLVGSLLLAARRGAPRNGRLWDLAETMGVLARGMANVKVLQQSILTGRREHQMRTALTQLESQVCQVWADGAAQVFCTGFLVGPDLVLTSPAILAEAKLQRGAADAGRVRIVFDATTTDTGVLMPGAAVRVAPEWLVASGGEIEYVLLRLATPVGEGPGAIEGRRGWMRLAARPDPARGSAVSTLRFDSRRALVFSTSPTGMRERDPSRQRLQYEIDGEGGGSGSPVLDEDLHVVAVHVARASGWLGGLAGRRLREGTAVDRILEDLEARGVTLTPPDTPFSEAPPWA
ncbi:MAG TPA: serine protease [Luteitalea sp.]|nr:serine protease [Luteitalea sp.]